MPGVGGCRGERELTSHCVQTLGGIWMDEDMIMSFLFTQPGCGMEGATGRLSLRSLGLQVISGLSEAPDFLSLSFLICKIRTTAVALPTSQSYVRPRTRV